MFLTRNEPAITQGNPGSASLVYYYITLWVPENVSEGFVNWQDLGCLRAVWEQLNSQQNVE